MIGEQRVITRVRERFYESKVVKLISIHLVSHAAHAETLRTPRSSLVFDLCSMTLVRNQDLFHSSSKLETHPMDAR